MGRPAAGHHAGDDPMTIQGYPHPAPIDPNSLNPGSPAPQAPNAELEKRKAALRRAGLVCGVVEIIDSKYVARPFRADEWANAAENPRAISLVPLDSITPPPLQIQKRQLASQYPEVLAIGLEAVKDGDVAVFFLSEAKTPLAGSHAFYDAVKNENDLIALHYRYRGAR